MKQCVIIGNGGFPRETASSLRILGVAKVFRSLGYDTTICGPIYDENARHTTQIDGIRFEPYYAINNRTFFQKAFSMTFFSRWFKEITLQKIKEFRKGDVVLLYSTLPIQLIRKTKRLASRNGFTLVFDVVEFFTIGKKTVKSFFRSYLPTKIINSWMIKKGDSVFAISAFLTDYFGKRGVKVLRVPFLLDMDEEKYKVTPRRKQSEVTSLIYAGDPGKKDDMRTMIGALASCGKETQKRIVFHLFGVNRSRLVRLGVTSETIDKCGSSLVIHGRVSHKNVCEAYLSADFLFLIKRPLDRQAKADFPSKVCECLAFGVPPFCNDSSDLSFYLKPGFDSIILSGWDTPSVAKGLQALAKMSVDQKYELSKNAKETAAKVFDYHNYTQAIKAFLGDEDV